MNKDEEEIYGGCFISHFYVLFLETEDVQALDLGAFAEKYSLTKRETEVLEALLNSDDSAKDLAKQLFISRAALYRNISSLNEKTGTKSRIGLIQFYYQQKNEE